jgi:UDP-N-acetylmuramoyl-L-alanyl-D-glutamate--2,6-diaminopimelate ligase
MAEGNVRLLELLSGIKPVKAYGITDIEITGVAYDSRKVEPGNLFFCITGLKVDGHAYAKAALDRGAIAIVVERYLPEVDLPQIVVDNSRKSMAHIASAYYGHPTRKIKLIGITGTNGKTTTAFMVEKIMRFAGYKTGLLGTIECRIGDEVLPVDRTTPESADLQYLFARMAESGVKAAVMEVSSHAIDLMRVEACEFDVVVYTNLSQDHLDYHGTMEEYFSVKKRIFDDTADCGVSHIINIDDEFGRRLEVHGGVNQIRYSVKEKVELNAAEIELRSDGSKFVLETREKAVPVTLKLPGVYNVSNALAAAGAASALGVDLETVRNGLEELDRVPGRFERVDCGQDYDIIVDYAHTPDSLEKILKAAKELTSGRLIAVFGCGGDRDRGKRSLMGRVAVELSDYVVVTSDNPRSEDPHRIIDDILEGIKGVNGASFKVVADRRKAIERAILEAEKGDFIVIAGKGHETGQEIAGRKTPFDDVLMVKEFLGEIG